MMNSVKAAASVSIYVLEVVSPSMGINSIPRDICYQLSWPPISVMAAGFVAGYVPLMLSRCINLLKLALQRLRRHRYGGQDFR